MSNEPLRILNQGLAQPNCSLIMPLPPANDAAANRDESPVSAIFRSAAVSYPSKEHPFRLPSTLPHSPYPSRFPPRSYIDAASSCVSEDSSVCGTVIRGATITKMGVLKSCHAQTRILDVNSVCYDEPSSNKHHLSASRILQGLQDEPSPNLPRFDVQSSTEPIHEKTRDMHTQACKFGSWNKMNTLDVVISPETNICEANAAGKQRIISSPEEVHKTSQDSLICRGILASSKWNDADKWLRNRDDNSAPEDKHSPHTRNAVRSIDRGTNSEGIRCINSSNLNRKIRNPKYYKNANEFSPNSISEEFLCSDIETKNSRLSVHRRFMSMGNEDIFRSPHSDATLGKHLLRSVDSATRRKGEDSCAAKYSSNDYDFKSIEIDYNVKQYQILEKLNGKAVDHDGSVSVSRGAVGENFSRRTADKDIQQSELCDFSAEKKCVPGSASSDEMQSLDIMKHIEISLLPGSERMDSVMKDVGTEMTPSISWRNAVLGSETSPFSTSTTSNSASPIKLDLVESPSNCASSNGSYLTSPACRFNTPARLSMSCHARSDAAENHLELEACHFAKLGMKFSGSHKLSFDMSYRTENTHVVLSNSLSPLEARVKDSHAADGNHSSSIYHEFSYVEARAAAWQEAEKAKLNAKYKCEQAKIDAWMNLQKAKAEAELKKFEMKLEKMRSRATEKLMSKMEIADKRAEEMKAHAKTQQIEQLKKVAEKASIMLKKEHITGGLTVCFTSSRT